MDQPSFPKSLSATRVNGHAVLHWKRNPEADVASYAVYRDVATGFRPSAANFVLSVAVPDTSVDLGPAPGAASYYTLAAVDASGYSSGFAAEATLGAATDVVRAVPYRLQLFANIPNPFNPATTIRYEVDRAGPVTVEIFDLSGRLVRTLLSARQEPGPHGVPWNGTDTQDRHVASGVYVVRLQSGERTLSRKIVALK
jgi:flagellar hook capping protein FlgD